MQKATCDVISNKIADIITNKSKKTESTCNVPIKYLIKILISCRSIFS